VLNDLIGFVQRSDQPMRVDFDGRTADGLIQISGDVNPFLWSENDAAGSMQKVSWTPSVEGLNVYVENVNASAFGDMVPDSVIKPVAGKMTGTFFVSLDTDGRTDYEAKVDITDVKYAINEQSSLYDPTVASKAKKALETYAKSGSLETTSAGQIGDEDFRLFPSIQTAMTREALNEAAPEVRGIAARDQIRYEDKETSPVLAQLKQVESTLKTVENIATTVDKSARTVNTATRTLNNVTRSLKSIFK